MFREHVLHVVPEPVASASTIWNMLPATVQLSNSIACFNTHRVTFSQPLMVTGGVKITLLEWDRNKIQTATSHFRGRPFQWNYLLNSKMQQEVQKSKIATSKLYILIAQRDSNGYT